MRAETRRPSPCRVSIGRAQENQGSSTEQAHGSGPGGKKASRIRDRRAGPSREPSGWANFAKKDNARRRYCTNPGRARDWPHGDPVRATFYPHRKRIFFFVRCSHQRKLFTSPKMVDRFFRYSQSSRRLIIGYLIIGWGSRSAADRSAMRSYPAGAFRRSDCRAPPTRPGLSMRR